MKTKVTIHGLSRRDGKLRLLIGHEHLKEPIWVLRKAMREADGKGKLTYDGVRAIEREIECRGKLAKLLSGPEATTAEGGA